MKKGPGTEDPQPTQREPVFGPAEETRERYQALRRWFAQMESAAIAYSGGCDSTLVLKVAHDELGPRCRGVIAFSASMPREEFDEALALATRIGAETAVVESKELEDPRYQENSSTRCYFCKSDVFGRIIEYAKQEGFAVVVDGTNHDDTGDHRPGRTAAKEQGVRSPLEELGFTKQDIRSLSRALGLSTWDKPAAPCLSSRIPYGTRVTPEVLGMVERSEAVIRRLGIREFRVRHHEKIARVEVGPGDIETILAHRDRIVRELREIGYLYVTLDLEGFRSGRLNEEIETDEH
jgi:uncharacterized protein